MAVSLLAYHNGSDYHISKQRLMCNEKLAEFEKNDACAVMDPPNMYASVHHFSSKVHLQRPIAGSQVPFCPVDKKVLDLWSPVEPNTFTVRAQNYLRVKKKEHSPNYAEYYLFGVDVFLSQRKMDHMLFVPLYPAAFFQGEIDGEGINFVLYFKLLKSYTKELASQCVSKATELTASVSKAAEMQKLLQGNPLLLSTYYDMKGFSDILQISECISMSIKHPFATC
ncbi:hypothetical protein Tco_0512100 [Tanacetum coccineum]